MKETEEKYEEMEVLMEEGKEEEKKEATKAFIAKVDEK